MRFPMNNSHGEWGFSQNFYPTIQANLHILKYPIFMVKIMDYMSMIVPF